MIDMNLKSSPFFIEHDVERERERERERKIERLIVFGKNCSFHHVIDMKYVYVVIHHETITIKQSNKQTREEKKDNRIHNWSGQASNNQTKKS